jgi:uncharacterized membrane protein
VSGWAPEHIIATYTYTYTYTYTHGNMIMYIYIRSYYILKRQRKENIAMLVFLAGTLVDFFTSPGAVPKITGTENEAPRLDGLSTDI